jgi:valyl-tRNA synthetase
MAQLQLHPDDPRYQHMIGTEVLLPLVDRMIPIIADELVDPDFGTGAVKVTAAHDPNDFEMAVRSQRPIRGDNE